MGHRPGWWDSESTRGAQPDRESLTVEKQCLRSCTLRASLPKDRAYRDPASVQKRRLVQQLTAKLGKGCEGNFWFSLVSSFALQLQRLRKFTTALFIFTVGDGQDAAVADHRTVERDRGDLRQRFIFDTVAVDLIVNPNHCGKRTNGEWTTLNSYAPGFID